MAARVDLVAQLPLAILRWLSAPGRRSTLFSDAIARLRRRLEQPQLPRMSDEWLESFNKRAGGPETR